MNHAYAAALLPYASKSPFIAHFSRDELTQTRMGGEGAKHLPSSLAFKKSQFQEHRNLLSFGYDAESLLHKLLRIFVWRIGHDVAVPFLVINSKKVSHLAVPSIYNITAHHFIPCSFQHFAHVTLAARRFQYSAIKLLQLTQPFRRLRFSGIVILFLTFRVRMVACT